MAPMGGPVDIDLNALSLGCDLYTRYEHLGGRWKNCFDRVARLARYVIAKENKKRKLQDQDYA